MLTIIGNALLGSKNNFQQKKNVSFSPFKKQTRNVTNHVTDFCDRLTELAFRKYKKSLSLIIADSLDFKIKSFEIGS